MTGPTHAIWRTELYRRLGERLDRVVGDKTAKPFAGLKVETVGDLLALLPRRYFSGTDLSDLGELRVGEEAAVLARVEDCRTVFPPGSEYGRGRGARPARVQARITDGRHNLNLAFFGSAQLVKYWASQLEVGRRGIFAGKVGEFQGERQLAHPDFVILDEDGQVVGGADRNKDLAKVAKANLVGLYPGTGKLRTWNVAASMALALDGLNGLEDPLPAWVRREAEVPELPRAWRLVHQPDQYADVERGRKRLRFDEAFSLQLAMSYRRADAARHGAVPRPRRAGGLLDAFDARLPFELTAGQHEVGDEIMTELAGSTPMQRLLQGEVGSGKTVVALRAMLATIDAGGQAALLAPTEVLAGQHFHTVQRMLGDLAGGGILGGEHATDVVLITGSMSAAARRSATLRAASGEAGIVIGTHALLSSGVQFAELGLVVVDEQHRFGVEQRAALSAKAEARPHVLVMTATPIPRSVAMTVFGDLEVSTLREVPAGRSEVSTVVVDTDRHPGWVDRAWARIVEEVGTGRQAYVVCPRISKNDEADAVVAAEGLAPPTSVEDLYEELSAGPLAELRVEMLHGRLSGEDKDAVMGRFAAGETDVLVATTVIEVGVDVPNASMMVICDADRFGISQLHQLRGRIGRGEHPGVCLLLSGAEPDSPARQRLDAVAGTRDGFDLAEIDLEQRREGDVLGASQSGVRSSLRLLRVLADADLIGHARAIADRCVAADPDLDIPGFADAVTAVERRAAGSGWTGREVTVSRIIAGSRRGRRLSMPTGDNTRPTTDRTREALFSALVSWAGGVAGPPEEALAGIAFVDLYAGSGAVGLEAASRGAGPVLLVESDRRTAAVATGNARALGLDASVVTARVERLAAGPADLAYDVVFADPPYGLVGVDEVVAAVVANGWLAPDGLLVVERSARTPVPSWPAELGERWEKTYGETMLCFAQR